MIPREKGQIRVNSMHAMNKPITHTVAPNAFSLGDDVNAAYRYCRELTFRHAKTFYFASHFLPQAKRNACYAVYAFCRYVDDLVDVASKDGSVTTDDAIAIVGEWRRAINDVYEGRTAAHPIIVAWEDTLRTFSIPRHLPEELIQGVLLDTTVSRFATFDDLYDYCYKVASIVGLMTSEIFCYSSVKALDHAVSLGIAMQLTNILRDVREDARMGRVYLPQDDLRRFHVDEHDVLQLRWTNELRELIAHYVDKAEQYYDDANAGICLLEKDSRLTVTLMSANYRKILDEIRKVDLNVMQGRVSTSLLTKLASIPTSWFSLRFGALSREAGYS